MAGDIKGLTVEFGGETRPLEAALKSVGREANVINKELGQVERALKFDPSNTVLLAQKHELLADKIKATRDRLDALKQAQERVDQMYAAGEIDDGQYRAFQRDIVTTENKLETFEGQLRDVEQQQRQTGETADKMATDIDKAADKSEKSGGKLIGSFKKVGAAAAAMAGAAVASVVGLVKSQDEYLGSMARLEQNAADAGYSVSALDGMMTGLAMVTTDVDERVEGLSNLMASGFDENQAADAIEALGGAAVKWSDTLKFEGLADGLQETLATGAAIGPFAELLDRAGVPLESFNEGLAEAKKRGDEQNYVLGVLAETGLADSYQAFKDNNEELAKSREASDRMQAALGDLSLAFAPLVTAATDAITPIVQGLSDMIAMIKGGEEPLDALSIMLAETSGLEISSFIPQEILDQLATFGEAISELGEVVLPTISTWYDEIIKPAMDQIVGNWVENFAAMIETVTAIIDFVKDNWPAIQEAIEPVMTAIVNIVSGAVQMVGGILRTVMAVIRGDWSAAWEGIKDVFKGIVDVIKGTNIGLVISSGFEIVKKIGGWFSDMYSKVKSVVSDLVRYLKDKFQSAKEAIENLNPFLRHSPSLVDNVLRGVKVIGDAYGGLSGMSIGAPSFAGVSAGFGGMAAVPSVPAVSRGGDVWNITVDGSRMPTADFNGLLTSIEQAKRMLGKG